MSTCGGATTGMWNHVRRFHPHLMEEEEEEEEEDTKEEEWEEEDEDVKDYKPGVHKMKSRSLVWNYFHKTTGALAVCGLCSKEICTVGNNTSGMIKHLSSIHQELNFQDMLEGEREARRAKKEMVRGMDGPR